MATHAYIRRGVFLLTCYCAYSRLLRVSKKAFILEAIWGNVFLCSLESRKTVQKHALFPCDFWKLWRLHETTPHSQVAPTAFENHRSRGCAFKSSCCQVLVNAGISPKTWCVTSDMCIIGLSPLIELILHSFDATRTSHSPKPRQKPLLSPHWTFSKNVSIYGY